MRVPPSPDLKARVIDHNMLTLITDDKWRIYLSIFFMDLMILYKLQSSQRPVDSVLCIEAVTEPAELVIQIRGRSSATIHAGMEGY